MSSTTTATHASPSADVRRRLAALSSFAAGVPAGAYISALVAVFYLVAAVAPGALQTHDPFHTDLYATLQPPSFGHVFGTDQSGRDVYSRVIEGASPSLAIGIGATVLSMSIALVLGVSAGLGGPIADGIIGRCLEVMFAVPSLFLALLFVTIFDATITTLIVAVGISTAPGHARMIRGQFLTVKNATYVEAARALGIAPWHIVRLHIFPNAMRPLVVLITLGLGQSIVWASGLAFLGLGVAPPSPEWGALLDAGRNYVVSAWWLEVMPGVAIIIFALSATIIGQHLQRWLEGRAHRA